MGINIGYSNIGRMAVRRAVHIKALPQHVWHEFHDIRRMADWFGEHAWDVPTFITLRLTSCYDGTLVELFHHGFERLGAKAASEFLVYESAWDVKHLKRLKEIVEGR